MKLFESRLLNRIAIWKTIGLIFWGSAFFLMPLVFTEADTLLRFGLLFWYITLWAIVWIFGVLDKHLVLNIPIPFWIRWAFIWGWMNFVLALFMYNKLNMLMLGTFLDWYSPFRIIAEWMLFWFIVDLIATKSIWEGKRLVCWLK